MKKWKEKEKTEKRGLFPGARPKDDAAAVMKAFGLPEDFPRPVKKEAARARERLSCPGKRLDLRRKFIFTCDPETARDYDDAISLEKDSSGRRILGVHIADVSHFVPRQSAMDREAFKRGTSVYLASRVVPMLPEELSNDVCSLVPDEDRFAFSVFMTFDAAGRMVARRFAKSVIRSKARFTYAEVLSAISGKPGGGMRPAWMRTLRAVNRLAGDLRKMRFAAGALDLEVPMLEVATDDGGEMTGITVRESDDAHVMVEECMVAANEAVAAELWPRGIRFPARYHEAPDGDRLDELRASLLQMGVNAGDLKHHAALRRLLKEIKKHPLKGVLSVMVLRSMKKALYDSSHIGHWGLAKKYYAHFTSPIRRYPDLVLHRILGDYLEKGSVRNDKAALARAAAHSTETEINAAEAERNLAEIKKYRYLEKNPGPYDAIVTKTMRAGAFVDLPSLAAGGMIHPRNLAGGRYVRWDAVREEFVLGDRRWRTGTPLKVCVKSVDFGRRWVDFIAVG